MPSQTVVPMPVALFPLFRTGLWKYQCGRLLAGSGGGGGKQAHGGTGAGAIKITAGGTLTIGADILPRVDKAVTRLIQPTDSMVLYFGLMRPMNHP